MKLYLTFDANETYDLQDHGDNRKFYAMRRFLFPSWSLPVRVLMLSLWHLPLRPQLRTRS